MTVSKLPEPSKIKFFTQNNLSGRGWKEVDLSSCLAWLLLDWDHSHSPPSQANLSYIIMSNNYFNNHHLLSPKSSHLSLSLHPFTENFLERAIYTAPFMVSLYSSSPSLKHLLLRYLTHCRRYLILHIYTGASSELIPKPHAQRFWCNWPEMRPRNAPVWQPFSNSGDAGNAEGVRSAGWQCR